MSEQIVNSTHEHADDIRLVDENEAVIDLSPLKNNLAELAHIGRVRLYAEDGSIAEISNPTREAWRDLEDWYHVHLKAQLSNQPRPSGFHSGPLPEGAQAFIHDRKVVHVGSELFGSVLFESSARRGYDLGPLFDTVLLRDIQKVELVAPKETLTNMGSAAVRSGLNEE